MAWTEVVWLRMGTNGGLMWIWQWTVGFHKMRGVRGYSETYVTLKLHDVIPRNTVFSHRGNLCWGATLMRWNIFLGGGGVCAVRRFRQDCWGNVAERRGAARRFSSVLWAGHIYRLGLESPVHDVKPTSLFTPPVMLSSYLLTPHRIN
jgi:hypothetical protein